MNLTSKILFLMVFVSLLPAQKNWQAMFKAYAPGMVTINYYEQLLSYEEIEDKERVKRFLTGIIVDDHGLILTSSAIYPARIEFTGSGNMMASAKVPTEIKVKFSNEVELPAKFIGKDDDLGIAFIRLTDSVKTVPVKFNRVKQLSIGQEIFLFSHLPETYDFTPVLVKRRINAISRDTEAHYYFEKNFHSLINFGLAIDAKGRAIGYFYGGDVRNSRATPFPELSNNALCQLVLFNQFALLIKQPPVFKHKQTVRKKWLGIYMQPFTRDLARYFGHPEVQGILVNTIIKNSPAESAGLLPGDVITKINDQPLKAEKDSDLKTLRQIIRNQQADTVVLEIFRKNHFILKKVNLRGSPFSQFMAEEVANPDLGFSVKELTRDVILNQNFEPDVQGVWVSRVERAGWADIAGLQIGDLIKSIDDVKIHSIADIKQVFKQIKINKPQYVKLFVQHNSSTRFLFIKTNYKNNRGDE